MKPNTQNTVLVSSFKWSNVTLMRNAALTLVVHHLPPHTAVP